MGKQVHFSVVEVEKAAPRPAPEWKPNKQEWTIMVTIAVVSLMVALDATVLVPVLPVSVSLTPLLTPLPPFSFLVGPPAN